MSLHRSGGIHVVLSLPRSGELHAIYLCEIRRAIGHPLLLWGGFRDATALCLKIPSTPSPPPPQRIPGFHQA
ncbi:hypothetical protein ZWY2020_037912 [Hordeum vulgare]|nr:hypothetical protein ZWY2020_037912 [Hordeum vulgare]